MAHRYISLGSACNAATMIRKAGLRRASYPFDWLLNVDDGLKAVSEIVRNNFEEASKPESYLVVFHPPAGRAVPTYKLYPKTFHVHSDPVADPNHHAEMLRRFDRMREALRSRDHLHFLYYRDYSTYRESNPGTTAHEIVHIMEAEVLEFLALVEGMRAGKTTVLVVVESLVEHEDETRSAVDSFTPSDNRLTFGKTVARYDEVPALNARWEREWINLLARKTEMPFWMWLYCRLKQANRRIRTVYSPHR
ncbi:DUF1796 family putative cysteine peptidase [uncultured Agrobacterium sp.]|uniref:DUF1796 family putative cysteine peptidase n=1 Tax=uncultured Agrobacterium sp. TaxID=157277 RepID=UPI0025D11D20|nr:DUF1796 family putative cysteine peptidase [uncultured Agrobacterium sp.]